jgi:hypothetical protein
MLAVILLIVVKLLRKSCFDLNLKSPIVGKPGGYVNVERRESLGKG